MATWKLDPGHSMAEFAARHMMITTVRGGFRNVTGTIEFDPANPTASSVDVVINTGEMTSTGLGDRDAHLKSPDFLHVEQYPTITFKSTRVKITGDNEAEVTGDLTIRDVTRPVTIQAELIGQAKSPWGEDRIGFSGRTKINREDFGLTWNVALETGGWLVGKDITITLEVEAIKVTEAVPA
ncbi:MAG: YceI family protein [Anaerolineae bacterium]|nr:YceI family protein [Anaerolineae bacterium]